MSRVKAKGSRDAVFIWIPKNAGTSIWKSLNDHHCPKLKYPYSVKHCFANKGIVTFGHQSYVSLKREGLISSTFDTEAFKFAFVRNPFDRTVSLFEYLKKLAILHTNYSFRSFCFLLKDRAFDSIGLYNDRNLSICNPQVVWTVDEQGKSFVDFVGRVENLEEDFGKVCKELKINCQLTHANKSRSKQKKYQDYFDDETRQIVEDVYADDLRCFGYRYDD